MLLLPVPVAYFNLLHANTKCIHHYSSLHSPHHAKKRANKLSAF